MPTDLRELLERTAASPTTVVDPAEVASRSRRRTRQRRGGAALTGVALVALLAVVAWPGVVPGDGLVIEDRAADQPDVPVLDLPEGWVQVQVGAAVFGIPGELEVVEVDADDPLPCPNAGYRAYLATESYPVATHDEAGREYACNLAGNTAPQLFAAPLTAVPAAHLGDDAAWHPLPIGDLAGEWRLESPADTSTGPDDDGEDVADHGFADRTAWYRVPAVDLHLRFVTTEGDVDLVEAILATITPIGTAATGAPDDEPDEPTGTGRRGATGLDLPEGWTQVTIGDATFGVPTDVGTREFELDILELAPTEGPPCHNGLDRVRAYLAPDGYPTGVVQDRDPGGVPHTFGELVGFCRVPLATYTSLLAAPLGTVPVSVREQQYRDSQAPEPVRTAVTLPGGLRGERTAVGDHLVTYALPQVDLWLEFHDPQREPELVDRVLATITSPRPLEDVSEPDEPDAGGDDGPAQDLGSPGVIWVMPGADVRRFETPGSSLPPEGRIIRDQDELDAVWHGAGAGGSTDDERPVPSLRDDEVALLASFAYSTDGSCRGEVELTAVEFDGGTVTLVHEPSLIEPCVTPGGAWTVAALIPADTRHLADVVRVVAVERR